MEMKKFFKYKNLIGLLLSALIFVLLFFPWLHIDFGYGTGLDTKFEVNPSMFSLKDDFISSQEGIINMCDSIGFDLSGLMSILSAALTCFSFVYIALAAVKLVTRVLIVFIDNTAIQKIKHIVDNLFFVLVYALVIAASIGGMYLSDMLYIARQEGFLISIDISLAVSPVIIMLISIINSKTDSM